MSNDSPERPRRGMPAETPADLDSDLESVTSEHSAEDTPAAGPARMRRGWQAPEEPESEIVDSPAHPAEVAADEHAAESEGSGGDHALFLPPDAEGSLSHTWVMRAIRDDDSAETTDGKPERSGPSPETGQPGPDGSDAATFGRPEPEAGDASDPTTDDDSGVTVPASDGEATPPSGTKATWRRLLPYSIAGLALALAVGTTVLLTTRKPAIETTASPTASTKASAGPVVDVNDLLTPEQAAAMVPKTTWTTAETLTTVTASAHAVACLAEAPGQPSAASTIERTLTSDSADGLAALHRIDGYNSVSDASTVFSSRKANLGTCDTIPLYIVDAHAVAGLGNEAFSITVADQESVTTMHTVLLVRTGTVIDSYDVAQNKAPVPPAPVAAVAANAIKVQCTKASGKCAVKPVVTASAPPPGKLLGWLGTADLPRVTGGSGLWTTTDPGAVSNTGIACEGMTLASVAGPTARQQRTYLLTQDSLAPTNFGVDEINLTFADAKAASAFATKLGANLANCAKSTLTAKITQASTIAQPAAQTGVGAISGRSMLIQMPTGNNASVYYRVAVVSSGTRVVYLLNNQTQNFGLSSDQINAVAVRGAQRALEVK